MKRINNSGQGLVELIVAIAIIEIGLFSVWSLFLVNFNAVREAEMRIVGVNLAREGIEVIKNIRDTNWLKVGNNEFSDQAHTVIWSWDENLTAGDFVINYDSDRPEAFSASSGNDQLYMNGLGMYFNVRTELSKPTSYKRKITLKDICCEDSPQDFKCDNSNYSVDVNDSCAGQLKIGINVVADVYWQISNKDRHAILEDNFFNWK